MTSKLKAAVVYHSAASYREPVFRALFSQSDLPVEFTLFSGTTSNQSSIRLLDPQLAKKPIAEGGLRWRLIRNFWMGQCLFQPYALLLPWQKRWDCVIFLGNAYYISTWISALLCRLRGKKVLMWTHGYRTRPRSRLKRWFKNTFYKLANGLVLYGDRAKGILADEGFDSERLFVAYNSAPGVPPAQSLTHGTDLPQPPAFKNNALPTLIWVGRMTTDKQLALLVDAIQRLHNTGTACNVWLIGDGPERANIQLKITQAHLDDHFQLPGAIHDPRKLAGYLNSASLAVSPGPIGLFAILAHGYGLPIVTNDNFASQGPEAEVIVANDTGSFFAAGSSDALADALSAWIKKPEKCVASRERCQQRIAGRYVPQMQVQVLLQAVNAVCKTPLVSDKTTP